MGLLGFHNEGRGGVRRTYTPHIQIPRGVSLEIGFETAGVEALV